MTDPHFPLQQREMGQGNQVLKERLDALVDVIEDCVRMISRRELTSMYHRGVVLVDFSERADLERKLHTPLIEAIIAPITFSPLTSVSDGHGEIAKEIVVLYMDEFTKNFGLGIIMRDYPVFCITLSAQELRKYVIPDGLSLEERIAKSHSLGAIVAELEFLTPSC